MRGVIPSLSSSRQKYPPPVPLPMWRSCNALHGSQPAHQTNIPIGFHSTKEEKNMMGWSLGFSPKYSTTDS